MSLTWHGIRGHLARTSCTLSFKHKYDRIRHRYPSVAPFGDPTALLDVLHDKGGTSVQKNLILSDLVRAAQSSADASDCALDLMLLALWPALDAVRRRSLSRGIGTADDINSELLARATEAIRSMDLQKVTWIAATIQRNVQRDMVRARQREIARQSTISATDPDEIADARTDRSGVVSLAILARDLAQILGGDALLVMRVALDDFTQAEVAKELGLTEEAARKRYQRAVKQLRAAFENLPH